MYSNKPVYYPFTLHKVYNEKIINVFKTRITWETVCVSLDQISVYKEMKSSKFLLEGGGGAYLRICKYAFLLCTDNDYDKLR